MALPPPKRNEMGALYLVFGPMELSAGLGYTTAFEGFIAFDLTRAQGTGGQTRALGCAPPAGAGQGKAPEDRFVFIEQNDLAPTCPVLEGRKVDRTRGEVGGGGIEVTSGTIVADVLFLKTPRTLSRPTWMPVCWASTVASSRQLHCEWMAPCWRGSSSTRRLRCFSSSQVILGGRPERGRSTKPWTPWLAKRWTHLRSAE